MNFEFYFILLVYVSGFVGGISYGFVYGAKIAQPTGSGLPTSTPPPMPTKKKRGCYSCLTPPEDFPLPAPNQARPLLTPPPTSKEFCSCKAHVCGALTPSDCPFSAFPNPAKRSFNEGKTSPKFDKDKFPEQYNG